MNCEGFITRHGRRVACTREAGHDFPCHFPVMDLHLELAQLIDDARHHNMGFVDCNALDLLLRRHTESLRPDLLPGDQLTPKDRSANTP